MPGIALTSAPMVSTIGNRFAFLGDSTTGGSSDAIDSTPQNRLGNAWPTYVALLSNGRIRHAVNAAKGGTKTDDMLANFDVRVAPYRPGVVAVLAGTNDITEVIEATWVASELPTYKSQYLAIIAKILGIGALPVICTVIPSAIGTVLRRTRTQQVNQWLRWLATSNKWPLVDFHRAMVDPSNGQFAAGLSSDGLHPNAAGNVFMAQTFVNTLTPLLPPNDSLLAYDNLSSGNLYPNPLFLTNTSGIPTGWSAFGAGAALVNSIVTGDTTILGNWAQFAVTDSVPRGLTIDMTTGWAVGDRMAFCGRLQYTYTSDAGVRCRVQAVGPQTEFSGAYDLAATISNGAWYKEFVVPVGTTNLKTYLGGSTGTTKVAQLGLYNMTALGIPASGGVPL